MSSKLENMSPTWAGRKGLMVYKFPNVIDISGSFLKSTFRCIIILIKFYKNSISLDKM